MSRTFVGGLLILVLIIAGTVDSIENLDLVPLTIGDGSVTELKLNSVTDAVPYIRRVSIKGSTNASFEIINVSSSAAFIIFQIHVYDHNVTLSYEPENLNKVSNRSVFGSNVGLLSKLPNTSTQLFVKNDNVHTVEAMIVAIAYNDQAPVPGGCNMEFNTETAPYAKVQLVPGMVIVDVQPPSLPLNHGQVNCEKNPVELEVYQMFLSEHDFSSDSYFMAIRTMLTVKDIKENGRKVVSSTVTSPMRKVFSAYTGVGSVYVAVAKYGSNDAAYVPAFSYACSPTVNPESCTILSSAGISEEFICASSFILGLLSVLFGHISLEVDMIFPLLFIGTVIGHTIVGGIGFSFLIGFCSALVIRGITFCTGTIGKLVFTVLTLGTFCSTCIYFSTPGTFIVVHNDGVFWAMFAFLALLIGVILSICSFVTHIATCAIFSSFMVILSIDYWADTSLKYIIINIIRRATVDGFNAAIILPPTGTKDICLILFWVFLACIRCFNSIKTKASGPEAIPLLGV